MTTILVTGATGTLGKPTVEHLRAAGHDVRALSRRPGSGTTGDLLDESSLAGPLAGAETVVHLSTGKADVTATRNLLAAAGRAGVSHLVLISIVGINDIPLQYYRDKVEIERLVVESGIPYTILRATQFHEFIDGLLRAQRWSPVIFTPNFSFDPIAVGEVATRLAELASSGAAGRVADIGGPQQRTTRDLAKAWKDAVGSRRPSWPLWLPGKTFAGFAAGNNLVPGPSFGHGTFDDYLAEKYGVRS